MTEQTRNRPETGESAGGGNATNGGTGRKGSVRASLPAIDLRGHGNIVGLSGVLVLLCVLGALTSPQFLTTSNLVTTLATASAIGVVTVGMTFVIIGGCIDLSVGSVIALAAVWCTTGATQSFGVGGMLFSALTVGTVAGLVNGVLIAYGRLVSVIATIAMMASARGLASQISGGTPQIVEVSAFSAIATTEFLGMPVLVYIFLGVAVAGWLLLNRTTFGRHVFAVGGNREAARLAGIDVRRTTALLFVISGLCAGVAAVILTARAHTGASTHGMFYELNAIAAVILGGTLLAGGRGTIVGSVLGVLVFSTITSLFILNNLQTPIQQIAKGAIIVIAVLIQVNANRRSATT